MKHYSNPTLLIIFFLVFVVSLSFSINRNKKITSNTKERNLQFGNTANELAVLYPIVFLSPDNSYILVTLDESVIRFDINSYLLTDSAKYALIPLINKIEQNYYLEIIGHTCTLGDESYNIILSRQRAESVKYFIQKNNPNLQNIVTLGLGENYPISDNYTREGRSKNRRVEIKIKNSPLPGNGQIQNSKNQNWNDRINKFITPFNSLVTIASLVGFLIQLFQAVRSVIN